MTGNTITAAAPNDDSIFVTGPGFGALPNAFGPLPSTSVIIEGNTFLTELGLQLRGTNLDDDFTTYATSGNDVFYGYGGADTLSVSDGENVFVYISASDSTGTAVDIITNFNADHDKINIKALSLEEFDYKGEASNFAQVQSALTGTAGDAVFWDTEEQLIIDVDGDGEIGAGDVLITLQGVASLTDDNFIV